MKEKNIEKENKKLKYGSSNVENVLIFVFFDAPTFPKLLKPFLLFLFLHRLIGLHWQYPRPWLVCLVCNSCVVSLLALSAHIRYRTIGLFIESTFRIHSENV